MLAAPRKVIRSIPALPAYSRGGGPILQYNVRRLGIPPAPERDWDGKSLLQINLPLGG